MLPSSTPSPPAVRRDREPRWLKELGLIAAFYAVYSLARNMSGSAQIVRGQAPQRAFDNAILVMRLERLLGLVSEQRIREWFLAYDWFVRFWNVYHGTLHFVATAATLVVLAVFAPARFTRWRNVLGFTTALAIIGFWLFPLMLPRLLDHDGPYGGARLADAGGYGQFGFTGSANGSRRSGGMASSLPSSPLTSSALPHGPNVRSRCPSARRFRSTRLS